MKKSIVALSVALTSFHLMAADARIEAMGGAGTAAASYLSAGFYNPALLALESDNTFGVLFPFVNMNIRDLNGLIDSLDDFGAAYDSFESDPTDLNNRINAANALGELQHKTSYFSGGLAGAVAMRIPNLMVTGNLFIKGHMEAIAIPEITDSDITVIENGNTTTPLTSKARVLAFGVIDVGLALAGNIEFAQQRIAIGITPKSQKIYTYHYEVTVDDFDKNDWNDDLNRTENSAFNLDVGAAWQSGPLRIGFAGKNIISNEIKTSFRTREYIFNIDPLFTLGGAYMQELFTVAIDIDLNKQTRFSSSVGPVIKDDTQFVRLGVELNAWGWGQLRGGYITDFEGIMDGTFTLGLGFSRSNIVSIDISAFIIDQDSYGAAAQLAFMF